jgi:acyl-CoA reductase-like NAD-dependent aldehyde dehydrogenase
VITNTRPDMRIVREEIFGPVVVAEPCCRSAGTSSRAGGREMGHEALEAYTEVKAVATQL